MRLPNYDDCSLQELYKFLADRHIPIKFTRAQAHTKTLYKRDKEERRKLTAALDKADAAATIPFMEFPPELRDQIYDYILTDMTTTEMMEILTKTELHERMCRVSTQFWVEARDVLNRGEYNIIPELVDLPAKSTTPAPAPATQSVALDSMTPNSIGPVIRRSRFSTIGPAGQGKSSVVSSPQSVSEFGMIPRQARDDRLIRMISEYQYASARMLGPYELTLHPARPICLLMDL
jgi:hypothetical protein